MVTIIGLTGRKRSGKSTAARYLVENQGFVELSFAQALKDMALAIDPMVRVRIESIDDDGWPELEVQHLSEIVNAVGWELAKDGVPEVRRFLQRLGTEGVRDHIGQDTWVNLVATQIADFREVNGPDVRLVIADVRFENEAALIRDLGGTVVSVVRDGQETGEPEHASEAGVTADYQITNPEGQPEKMLGELLRVLVDRAYRVANLESA